MASPKTIANRFGKSLAKALVRTPLKRDFTTTAACAFGRWRKHLWTQGQRQITHNP